MKMIVAVALALVAVVAAAPVDKVEVVPIVRSSFDQAPEGAYQFGFEAANGIIRDEQGELKQVTDEENKPHQVVVVRGSYQYPGEEGRPILVTYYADETGYHAEGDSIPKPARR